MGCGPQIARGKRVEAKVLPVVKNNSAKSHKNEIASPDCANPEIQCHSPANSNQ